MGQVSAQLRETECVQRADEPVTANAANAAATRAYGRGVWSVGTVGCGIAIGGGGSSTLPTLRADVGFISATCGTTI